MNEITLFGFNNLTKSLHFSLYKLHYVGNQSFDYNRFIKERFSANKLNSVLTTICHAIGGNVLNIAKQDYQPQGASVTLMISEELPAQHVTETESIVAHLDKSHLCIHTYPEDAPQDGIAIFRADIELSTCGIISPLKVLNQVIEAFDADVIDIDYRVRGMTRDKQGNKIYNFDQFDNLNSFLSTDITQSYHISEHHFRKQNLFHAKLSRKNVMLNDYLVEKNTDDFNQALQRSICSKITKEIKQLFTNSE
jgi:S-adenosylmethionine decarboxylase